MRVLRCRRRFLQQWLLSAGAAQSVLPALAASPAQPSQSPLPAALLTRAVPSSGELLPLVGLGSWITFNVGRDRVARDGCAEVVRAFFDGGGRLIDSSPMYGSSQAVIGDALSRLGTRPVFAADKVWVSGAARGESQIEQSRRLWGVPRFQLLQVHNLLDWQTHLPRLLAMKASGQLRYVGITTSEGRRHTEFEQVLRTQPIDFIQLTYNPLDRAAEQRLLPLAQERGVAVIVNRPFREGALLQALQGRPLPAWAAELQCDGWAQLVLKFIVSHPTVTCAIPATSRVDHVRQNLGAARGALPDAALRERIAAHLAAL
jgi:diketogulonate reductase-like aldo/keto reductase